MALKISHINVRSLVLHFDEFKTTISDKNFDVIGVTETWLSPNIKDDIVKLDGYLLERCDRVYGRGGGTAIYVRNDLRYEVIFSESHDFLECIWVKISTKKETFVFGTIYRPPKSNGNLFLDRLEDNISSLYSLYNNIFCVGDFNIDILQCDNLLTQQLILTMEPFNLEQIITEPTRVAKTSFSLIDLIFTNYDRIVGKGVIYSDFSDHFLVYCEAQFSLVNKKKDTIIYRNLKDINLIYFQRDLESIPFDNIYEIIGIEEKISFLDNALINIFNIHAPLKNLTIRKKPFQPWITENIKRMQKLRDAAFREFKRTKLPGKWEYYKSLRNLTTSSIRLERKAYYRHKFKNCSVKEKWQELNKLTPSKIKDIPEGFRDVDKLNDFFVNSTNSNYPVDQQLLNFYLNSRKNNIISLLKFKFVENYEVHQIINKIKSKAFGSDGLNITLIVMCCPHICEYITHIINECIKHNYFPVCWKEAIVTPLPKVNNPNDYSHFRSISVLPTMSKILERILDTQIRVHIDRFLILPQKQSGFRSGYSCATAMADVIDDIIRARDNNEITALVLLDFTKAFDFLNHDILIALLHYIGFTNDATMLIKSFLSDRCQRVRVGNDISECRLVLTGVPQGSILGPLLFSIYTSCFPNHLKFCRYHLYADDTQMYYSFLPSDYLTAMDNINSDLDALVDVSTRHMLKLNPKKSIVVLIGNKNSINSISNEFSLSISNQILQVVENTKSLGLVIDSQLKFSSHISYVLKKSYCALKTIYPHRHYLDQNVKRELCDSLVLSHFNHCDIVYGPCLDSRDSHRIQKMQNSCIRFIFGMGRHCRVSHRLKDLKWLNMTNRRKLHSILLFCKIIKHHSPPYLYDKITFRTDVHHLNLRRNTLTIPKHRSQFFKRSFSYNICRDINAISLNFDLSNSIFTLKKKLKRELLECQ